MQVSLSMTLVGDGREGKSRHAPRFAKVDHGRGRLVRRGDRTFGTFVFVAMTSGNDPMIGPTRY